MPLIRRVNPMFHGVLLVASALFIGCGDTPGVEDDADSTLHPPVQGLDITPGPNRDADADGDVWEPGADDADISEGDTEPGEGDADLIEPDTGPDADEGDADSGDADTPPDTPPIPTITSLYELMPPFWASEPGATEAVSADLYGLVVLGHKPAGADAPAGFFAAESRTRTYAFFVSDGSEMPALGSQISLQVHTLENLGGMPAITAYDGLEIGPEPQNIFAFNQDVSDWTPTQYEDSYARFIDIEAYLEGPGEHRDGQVYFPFSTSGMPHGSDLYRFKVPETIVDETGMGIGCYVALYGGFIWAEAPPLHGEEGDDSNGGNRGDSVVAYQPMLIDAFSYDLLCEHPQLLDAHAPHAMEVELYFNRPISEASLDAPDVFTFDPPLDILSSRLSEDGLTLTLETAYQDSETYLVFISDDLRDISGESLELGYREAVFQAGALSEGTAFYYCFEDEEGTFTDAPSYVASPFAILDDWSYGGERVETSVTGVPNTAETAHCSATTSRALLTRSWPTAAEFEPETDAFLELLFAGPEGEYEISMEIRATDTGPKRFMVTTGAGVPLADEFSGMSTQFRRYPAAGETLVHQHDGQNVQSLRIYAYDATSAAGTFAIDHFEIRYRP